MPAPATAGPFSAGRLGRSAEPGGSAGPSGAPLGLGAGNVRGRDHHALPCCGAAVSSKLTATATSSTPRTTTRSAEPASAGGLDGGRQLLHRGDSVATHGDDQVAPVDARTVGGPTLLDGVDQQTVTLRQPYGMAKATSHPRRSESYAKAYPVGRFSASQTRQRGPSGLRRRAGQGRTPRPPGGC